MKFTPVLLLLFNFLFIPSALHAQTETTSSGNLLYVKLGNGMNAVLMPFTTGNNTEITFYVKTGSVYESDSVSGIANVIESMVADKIAAYLRNTKNPLSFQNTVFNSYSTTEHAIFKISTSSANFEACMNLLRDSVLGAKFTSAETDTMLNAVLRKIKLRDNDKDALIEEKIMRSVYRQDKEKLSVLGNAEMFKNIDLRAVNIFFKKYYVPNNSYVAVTGNFTYSALQQQFEKAFGALVKSEFDPETVTKIIDFHPMVYTSQFIVEDSAATPEFQICWQFPGTISNIQSSYNAHLIAEILNDRNNFIQVKAAKMGCKKFAVQYECNGFSGILRVTLQPAKENFAATYRFVVGELNKLDKTLVNPAMMNAAKLQFKKDITALSKTKEYPQWVIKHWAFKDESYFPTLGDSVFDVKEKELRRFVIDYMNQSPHVSGLRISKNDREAFKIDSVFTDVDDTVAKYIFRYRPNIYDLEGEDNTVMLRNLLQWLSINTDVSVQVNGFSDEHEFNKAYDDSVMSFIDSIPTFEKTMPEIIRKRHMRPEMLRAMKIVKYLYEHDIAANRLSGTSMMFKSATKQEETENMKCTVTLNKYHKSPSLYEYHYGKPKEPERKK